MSIGIIYLAKNTISNKCYVGQSTRTLEVRKKQHLIATIKEDYKFGRALRKYPADSWEWSILAEVPTEQLDEYERFFIKDLDSYRKGYNASIGGNWKKGDSPNQSTTVYELWHPEHGEIRETLTELYKRSASFGLISMLIKGKRFHINGYVLLKNKENYNTLLNKHNFYHPTHGVINCSAIELFRDYSEYFNGKESKIYNLVGGRTKVCSGWVLAENKDNYEDLINPSTYITLTHKEHGTLTLKRSEFKERYELTDQGMSLLIRKKRNSHKGWENPTLLYQE